MAVYVPAFVYCLARSTPYDIISDEVKVITKDASQDHDVADVDPKLAEGEADAELDVEETIVVEIKDPAIIKTLLTGLPSPSSLLWSAVTFGINLVLFAMVMDLVYRATFFYPSHELSLARVGYVSDTTASLLVREPDAAKLPVFASYRMVKQGAAHNEYHDISWKAAGTIQSLDNSTDFTGTFTLKGLTPDTTYQYTASNHTGFFRTAPPIGYGGLFTFVHSSCLKNNFPYNPFAHPLSNKGLRTFNKAISDIYPRFMLFLGDFIYIDVPRRHGSSVEDHRREYRQMYSSPDWSAHIPWLHVYDDHEIANDWDKNTTGVFEAANDPYRHYHTSVNPPAVRTDASYFSFTQGPATFFMLDTRRYRSPNDNTNGSDPITGKPTKSMLGKQQLSDLLAWLKRREAPGVRWKIVVSSVPFTKNWAVNGQDSWRGYLGERELILEAMWDVGLRGGIGVIILSGDRHEFAATAFPPPPDGKEIPDSTGVASLAANALGIKPSTRKRWPLSATVHEFSASPLNMFYLPFRSYFESSTSSEYISDVAIKYIPDGNSKFGAVSISTPPTSDQSILHYRLFVDGEEAWSYTLTTPPNMEGGSRAKDAIWG